MHRPQEAAQPSANSAAQSLAEQWDTDRSIGCRAVETGNDEMSEHHGRQQHVARRDRAAAGATAFLREFRVDKDERENRDRREDREIEPE
jgi:hypothetical protein